MVLEKYNLSSRGKERGAALIVVLVLASVSLAVGLSSVRVSQLDETLAGNHRALSRAQMGAEHAASVAFKNISSATFEVVDELYHEDYIKFYRFKDVGEDGGCGDGVLCVYDYIKVKNGVADTPYIVAMGVVQESAGSVASPGRVVAQSDPVFIELYRGQGFGGLSSALTVFGGITTIHDAENVNKTVQWLPDSRHAEIRGGELSNDELITALYYEGMSFNISTIKGNNPIVGDVDHAGEADASSMLFLEWLIGQAVEGYNEHELSSNFFYDVDGVKMGSATTNEVKDLLVNNATTCDASNTYFAIVENYDSTGSGKFCGVLVSLGGKATLGGTVAIDGMFIAANPVDGFDSPSEIVDVTFKGGGGKPGADGERGGSVRFVEDAVEYAFSNLGLNYWDFMSGSMGEGFGSYRLKRWQ